MEDEATRKNILAIKQFTEDTRKDMRSLEEQVKALHNRVLTQDGVIANLNQQIGILNAKLLQGGSTQHGT